MMHSMMLILLNSIFHISLFCKARDDGLFAGVFRVCSGARYHSFEFAYKNCQVATPVSFLGTVAVDVLRNFSNIN